MENFNISDYLKEYDKAKKSGKCIGCLKNVYWARDRIANHKRASCSAVSAEERTFFAKRKHLNETSSADISSSSISDCTPANSKDIDAAVANFFFRTGIAFKVADSAAFKNMLQTLNPEYAKDAPSARVLGGRLLDKKYSESKNKVLTGLADAENLTLTSDGWTNLKGDHIVNFVIKAPGQKPVFYKSIDTTGIAQTAVAVAEAISAVIEEIGASKIVAVVTDNTNVMKAAWQEIESRYPHISAYGCAAHGMNLLIKNILEFPHTRRQWLSQRKSSSSSTIITLHTPDFKTK